MLALQTGNRQAFELVADAVTTIASYRSTRDRGVLEGARAKLDLAREHDARYLLAPYYIAVIDDLLGRSQRAAKELAAILPEAPTAYPKLINEMRFNLAVAQYHGYSHERLEEAAKTLDQILSETSSWSLAFKLFRVRLYSRALLSQVEAMWCIPKLPEDVATNQDERSRIEGCYKSANINARRVLYYSPMLFVLAVADRQRYREIRAIARNALGMAAMYYTDFFLSYSEKVRILQRGLAHLLVSDRLFPRDWANQCDIGSCHMRLGYWTKDSMEFETARKYLFGVVQPSGLRPNYDFGLYEIGRSYRIEGRFDEAIKYLKDATQIKEEREVRNERIYREIYLAERRDSSYP